MNYSYSSDRFDQWMRDGFFVSFILEMSSIHHFTVDKFVLTWSFLFDFARCESIFRKVEQSLERWRYRLTFRSRWLSEWYIFTLLIQIKSAGHRLKFDRGQTKSKIETKPRIRFDFYSPSMRSNEILVQGLISI